jgi:hypothetical protein
MIGSQLRIEFAAELSIALRHAAARLLGQNVQQCLR